MTYLRGRRFRWLFAALLLWLATWLIPHQAQAATCAATLSFNTVGDQGGDNFTTCDTELQPSSDGQDVSSPRYAGLQTSLGAAVRGPFNCGVGTAAGCRTPAAQSISTANATWTVSTNLINGTVTFTLSSRSTMAAFNDTLTLYTFVGAATEPVVSSLANTAYTYTFNVAAEGATITLSPTTLPQASVGTAYQPQVTATGGTGPYTYAYTGTLPDGITLGSDGKFSGVPTTVQSTSFTVTATDATLAHGTQAYSITVVLLAPTAQDDVATFAANSSANVITPRLGGGPATSLTIDTPPQHGSASVVGQTLHYTPQAGYSGSDSLRYTAGNTSGSASANIGITVTPPVLTFTPAAGDLPFGTQGTAYTGVTIQAGNGTAPYRYAVTAGSLPTGLSLDPNSGALTGTPTTSASASFTVTATDAYHATGSVAYRFAIGSQVPSAGNVAAAVITNSRSNALVLRLGGGAATSVAVVTMPSHGSASVSGTTISYTPQTGFSGIDSFTYTASNASGTSAPGTITVTVAAPSLTVAPAPGTLPNATVGVAYGQTFTAVGGSAPYRYTLTGKLPAGLSFSGASITGTPTAVETARFSIDAIDANGVTVSAAYTLPVQGAEPVAPNRSVQLLAGASLNVDLTDGASGGPFTGATIVTAPPAASGSARISGQWQMAFTAAPTAVGTVVVRYTLSNAWQTSAPATITFTVVARPDPSKDPEVIGLLNAEARAAQRFATTQISNFGSRLERLHDESARHANAFGVQFSGGQSARTQDRPTAYAALDGPAAAASGYATDAPSNPVRPDTGGRTGNAAVWTGGFVNFGSSNTSGADIDHTTVGVSMGVDYRFSPNFVAGVGFGYGQDVSDVGTHDTQSKGKALSAAFYGSYHPSPYFVDGLVGVGRLDFDSRRYVTDTGGRADGSRDGNQIFGSLSSGYEYRSGRVLVSPYGRFQASWTRLDSYTEDGAGVYSLTYGKESLSMLSGVAGLRGEYAIPMKWGILSTRGRIEYLHDFAGSSWVSMGYADLGTQPYRLNVEGLSRNTMAVELGVQGALDKGMTVALSYRSNFGFTDQMRENSVELRFTHRF